MSSVFDRQQIAVGDNNLSRTMGSITLPEKSILRVGLIGCGEIGQVVHIPTLGFLSDLFRITFLCDVSRQALEYCRLKVVGGTPNITTDPNELCASPDVDVVFVINSDEYHADHAILALHHDKSVFVEKPLALNLRDIERIKQAEKASRGKLMVGYMRRYAAAFVDGVKEIGGIDKILYARFRGMISISAWKRSMLTEMQTSSAPTVSLSANRELFQKDSQILTRGIQRTKCSDPQS